MTNHEIVALRCPSCSGAINQPTRETTFGAEFSCEICGITSVLIINQALVPLSTLQKLGEKVCTICGRIAQREARFCQDGHSLVRNCINCDEEFAVDHQRCDFCGWEQTVKPFTEEGKSVAFERAISEITNPSWSRHTIEYTLNKIIAGGINASNANATAAATAIHSLMTDTNFRERCGYNDSVPNPIERICWEALGSIGKAGFTVIHSLMIDTSFRRSVAGGIDFTDGWCLQALGRIGPVAGQSIPTLLLRMEKIWAFRWGENKVKTGEWNSLFSCLCLISPKDALSICSRSLEEVGNQGSDVNKSAVKGAFDLGKNAIPMLEKFCGLFSGDRGRYCKAAISALRNGESWLHL